MLPLQYDQPYIWCPSIYSRPFELYPLYKCRAGHQVFSKVTLSQGAAQLNRHYMVFSRTHYWQNTKSAEHNCQQNTTVGRIHSRQNTQSAEYTVSRIHIQQNTLSAEMTVGKAASRTHYRQNTTIGRTQLSAEGNNQQNTLSAEHNYWQNKLSAEYTVGRIHCWQNTTSAQHVIGNLPSA